MASDRLAVAGSVFWEPPTGGKPQGHEVLAATDDPVPDDGPWHCCASPAPPGSHRVMSYLACFLGEGATRLGSGRARPVPEPLTWCVDGWGAAARLAAQPPSDLLL